MLAEPVNCRRGRPGAAVLPVLAHAGLRTERVLCRDGRWVGYLRLGPRGGPIFAAWNLPAVASLSRSSAARLTNLATSGFLSSRRHASATLAGSMSRTGTEARPWQPVLRSERVRGQADAGGRERPGHARRRSSSQGPSSAVASNMADVFLAWSVWSSSSVWLAQVAPRSQASVVPQAELAGTMGGIRRSAVGRARTRSGRLPGRR